MTYILLHRKKPGLLEVYGVYSTLTKAFDVGKEELDGKFCVDEKEPFCAERGLLEKAPVRGVEASSDASAGARNDA